MELKQHRRTYGPKRVTKLVDTAVRAGMTRVELVDRHSFAPPADPTQAAAEANSALLEVGLPWEARVVDGRVWIEKEARA